jgi:hypothetical protein
MKGTRRDKFKNAAISILSAIVVMRSFVYPDTAAMLCIGYVVVQVVWVALITYDEILRQRRAGMASKQKTQHTRRRRSRAAA